jgi:hypothetical protein
MKNQYFGDSRDYFKYEVIDRLASDLDDIVTLTCLWMLTPSDATGHGQIRFVPSPHLPELTKFFRERLEPRNEEQCRVSEMATYFSPRPFHFVSYGGFRRDLL